MMAIFPGNQFRLSNFFQGYMLGRARSQIQVFRTLKACFFGYMKHTTPLLLFLPLIPTYDSGFQYTRQIFREQSSPKCISDESFLSLVSLIPSITNSVFLVVFTIAYTFPRAWTCPCNLNTRHKAYSGSISQHQTAKIPKAAVLVSLLLYSFYIFTHPSMLVIIY